MITWDPISPDALSSTGFISMVGSMPRGLRLKHLRPPDLPPVGGDVGIEGHILRLERGDAQSLVMEDPAQPRNDETLARAGAGALYHQCFSHVVS